eukprot:222997-Pleurochrysis_carterae.AAC.1
MSAASNGLSAASCTFVFSTRGGAAACAPRCAPPAQEQQVGGGALGSESGRGKLSKKLGDLEVELLTLGNYCNLLTLGQ